MRWVGIAAAVSCCVAALMVPAVSRAAVGDPCASAGRDICGTLGVGFYKQYRYGIRWFGDFRRAIPGEAHSFCIDLGYWYAARSYRYRPTSAPLRNRAGKPVPLERQRELAYAAWRYGRSTKPKRQAAVMLYVHSRMGDARPGELDPAALGPSVASTYRRIARDSARYHGPYTLRVELPATLTVGEEATAQMRLVSAHGYPLRDVRLSLSGEGASGLPAQLETSNVGVARVTFTPRAASGLRLRVATTPLASARPRIFAPTAAEAVAHGQRLAVPASQPVVTIVSRTDIAVKPQLSTRVSTQLAVPGTSVENVVSVTGSGGASVSVRSELWGPFASRSSIHCTGAPYSSTSFVAQGDSTRTTAQVKLTRAGFYAYRTEVMGSDQVAATSTSCALDSETALAVPLIATGRGDATASVAARASSGATPVRLRIPSLGVDAPVSPAAIDLAHGELAIPSDIARVGWWRDGVAPAAHAGAILLAGHVDSARAGKGALFNLARAGTGDVVQVKTAAGRTFAYRVTSVRSLRRTALPTAFSRTGRARLVIVTCGGPFDAASGHYRDNIVVTAVPTPS